MKIYRKLSKIILIIISIVVFILAYYNKDTSILNMLYYNVIFNLLISLDFLFYVLYSKNKLIFNHYNFVFFTMSRYEIMFKEVIIYLKRVEFIFLLSSIFYFLISYYLNNKYATVYNIILFFLDFILQVIVLLLSLFILKNTIKKSNFNVKIKNLVSYFFSITVILTAFSDKSEIIKVAFYYNPLNCAFYSNIAPFVSVKISYMIIFFYVICLSLFVNVKFKEWPI